MRLWSLPTFALLSIATRAYALEWEVCEDFNGKVDIKSIELSPDPIRQGLPVKIKINAHLDHDITEDAYVKGEARYLFIKVPVEKTPICDLVKCPIGKGDYQATEHFTVSDEYPSGTYHIHLEGYTKGGTPLFCGDAEVDVD